MEWKKLFKNDFPVDPNFDEETLRQMEDAAVRAGLENSRKNVVLKQFIKDPYTTLCAYPDYTFIISTPVALVFLIMGLVRNWPNPIIDDVIFFSVLIAIFPASVMYQKKMKHITKIEEYLPTFLRDISEMSRAGLTLSRSVATVAKGEYGELSPEIKKMNDLMSWGISFERSLLTFAHRMNTALIDRSVALITQASKAGGRVSQVLEAAARDSTEVKQLERERKGNMMVYLVIIYMSFFVFLFVIAMLSMTFVPTMVTAGQAATDSGAGGQFMGVFDPDLFIRVMFHASLVQGFFSGLVAGQMGEGAVSAGLKHSIVLSLIAWATFTFFI